LVTAALVVSNKHVMGRYMLPGAAALLTLLHTTTTAFTVRVGFCCASPPAHNTPWPWLLGINLLGSLSIMSSNYLLKLSSVAFHQASRLMTLPAGALIDYFVNGKLRTAPQYFGLALIAHGVILGSSDATVAKESVFVAVVFNLSWLLSATLIKHVCQRYGLSSGDFLFLSAPWSIASSFMWLVVSGFQFSSVEDWQRKTGLDWLPFAVDLLVNVALAISVNYLSTWAQRNCSALLYAVMSQVKTACTVALSAGLFHTTLTSAQVSGLGISLAVACALAVDDADMTDQTLQKKRQLKIGTNALLILASMILVSYHVNIGLESQYQMILVNLNQPNLSATITKIPVPSEVSKLDRRSRNSIEGLEAPSENSKLERSSTSLKRRVCVIDAGITHVDLLMNCYLSLMRLGTTCDEFRFLCYDAAITQMLKSYGFLTIFNATLVEEANRIMTVRSECSRYLMIPMYVKTQTLLNLAKQDVDVLLVDADTVFLQNPFDFFKDGMMVSASPAYPKSPFGNTNPNAPGMWFYPHGSDGSWMTLNNGILCLTGSYAIRILWLDVVTRHMLPNMCSEGWAQTYFNSYVHGVLKSKFVRNSSHPGLWNAKLPDGKDFVAFSNVLTLDDMTPVNPIMVHAAGTSPSPSGRIAWLDSNRAWVLRSDWRSQASRAVEAGVRATSQTFADLLTNATKLRASLLCTGTRRVVCRMP
jgi:drug/metabolite transporter (DMT)-like permease